VVTVVLLWSTVDRTGKVGTEKSLNVWNKSKLEGQTHVQAETIGVVDDD
jgi:hypothetical protein